MILAAIMVSLAYLAVSWRYTSVIDQLKTANDTLKERLLLKTEQSESYKERALKYDQKVFEIVDSTSVDLKNRALELVRKIMDFSERYQKEDRLLQDRESTEMRLAKTEEERNNLWTKFRNESSRLSNERNAEYDRRLKINALLLRDEMRSRLKDYKPAAHMDSSYEHPTNYHGFQEVADDLEKMAKLLPSSKQ